MEKIPVSTPLCVICRTFNHAPFILDTLRGFVLQETNFPFTVLVVDDASTDGEPEVIRQFLEHECNTESAIQEDASGYRCMTAPHRTNTRCTFAVLWLKYNHYSRKKSVQPYLDRWTSRCTYIATCEGDDYWIHPKKLQLQVDFLESHPEFDLCCGRFHHLIQSTGEIQPTDLYDGLFTTPTAGLELTRNHYRWDILAHFCTVVYRSHTLVDLDVPACIRYEFDIAQCWLYFLRGHRIWLMNVPMSVYRKHEGGLTLQAGHRMRRMLWEEYADLFRYDHCEILQHQALRFWKEYVFSQRNCHSLSMRALMDLYVQMLRLRPGFMAWGSATKCMLGTLGNRLFANSQA